MTLKEVIDHVDVIKPNAFDEATKTMWVNEVEGFVQTEVFLLGIEDVIEYVWADDKNKELFVNAPHSKLYWTYLSAMIDFANGEYNKYQNTMAIYNAFMNEYIRWFSDRYHPADGECEEKGYYISAYGIAVKHGFVGTEEEWLESLRGARGDYVELRYNDAKLEWKYSEEDEWSELMDITDLRTEIENDTINDVNSAKSAAQGYSESAASSALAAASSASDAAGSVSEASASASEASASASEAASSASDAAGSATNAASSASAASTAAAQSASETAELVRAEMQGYVTSASGYASSAASSASTAASSETAAAGSASSAAESAGSASDSASAASASATAAAGSASTASGYASAASASATEAAAAASSAAETAAQEAAAAVRQEVAEDAQKAADSAEDSEAWAVGQRGGTDVPSTDETYHNNSKYWAEQAAAAAGGGVSSFNGRNGAVSPQIGDYTAAMVGADESGAAAAVQSNLTTHSTDTDIHVTAAEKATWNGKQDAIPANTYDAYGTASAVQSNLQTQIDAITSQSDVVDVVGTYSELQAYSKPTYVDDIVKVLVDSTHSNAIAYYRCEEISGTAPGTPTSWTYIGSQGPFYTKSETDTLLNGKQNTIPANTYDAYGAASSAVSTHNSSSGAHSSLFSNKVDKASGSSAFTLGRDSNGIYVDY